LRLIYHIGTLMVAVTHIWLDAAPRFAVFSSGARQEVVLLLSAITRPYGH